MLAALPAGETLGDVFRVALLNGVRLEELASLDATQVDPQARWYLIREGETANASRVVPLVDMARSVIKARLEKAKGRGLLFPELSERKSTGKRGGAISQDFTRVRRKVIGKHTDGELTFHSLRHLWRTATRRAGVDDRTSKEMGGWSRGKDTDLAYDHGLEFKQYEGYQRKVVRWFKDNGYIP